MRILFLTNYFPPHELGGQGRSCLEVFDGLTARGHECIVLTSMHGVDNVPTVERGIRRLLYLEMDMVPLRHSWIFFTQRKKREAHNLTCLERLIAEFQPEVIYIWGMWNLPRTLPALAERLLPGRVAYRFAEYWPTLPTQHEFFWRATPQNWRTYLPKKILSTIALAMLAREKPPHIQFEHVMCVSAGTRQVLLDAGVPISHARVIHTGLDVDEFLKGSVTTRNGTPTQDVQLLYAGRLSAEKGLDTVIEAMHELVNTQGRRDIHLRLAGGGLAAYLNELHQKVTELGLGDAIEFLGRVPSQDIPNLMQASDILIVPSIWPEPFARVVLEGMVCKTVVLATPTGGTGEIIEDGKNGVLFPAGDSHALAERIKTLAEDPAMRKSLAQAGWHTVMQNFTKKGMLDEIEAFLLHAATPHGTNGQR